MMKLIHIKINEIQEKELQMLMEHEGYTNKSEFIRYLMKFYKMHQGINTNPPTNQKPDFNIHQGITKTANNITTDENLSPEKRKLLSNPHIFDEGVRQFIREMED